MKQLRLFVTSLCLLLVSTFAIADNMKNLVEVAAGDKNFSTLVSLVKEAGLVDALQAKGPYTVFAPTNAAFAKVPVETLNALKADKEKLKKVLLYHVVSGEVMSGDVKTGMVKTLEGQDLDVKVEDGKVMVNNARVIGVDVKASNGVIHVINEVLVPNLK